MTDKDLLQRFLFENAPIRGEIVHLDASYQTIMQQHNYPPIIRQLLGECLVVASLLSAIIKFKGRLTVQFQGKSGLKLLLAQCNQQFHLRGLAQWNGELDPADIWDLLNQGLLAIMMDPEVAGGKRYQSIVQWQGKSIAESIEGYFKESEQLATRLWLASDQNSAAGLLLQVMPKEKPELFKEDWNRIVCLTETITPTELLTLENHVLLHRLYSEEDRRLFEKTPVSFQCNCSYERGENAILLLGREEVEQEIKDKQHMSVVCEFCSKEFLFDRVDIAAIFKKKDKPLDTNLH